MVTYSKTFRDVIVWQRAHAFVLEVYRLTASFPQHEQYGLTSQFRRAAVSIAANFVEGFKKRGIADKLRFYNIAQGSIEECEYYIILASDLEYGDTTGMGDLLAEVGRLLEAYAASVSAARR
jgi:four helix bundle protein